MVYSENKSPALQNDTTEVFSYILKGKRHFSNFFLLGNAHRRYSGTQPNSLFPVARFISAS